MEGALTSGDPRREHLDNGEDHVPRKRRRRGAISPEQLRQLEALYYREQWPKRATKELLARDIGKSIHFINVWFQNKRSRVKKQLQGEGEPSKKIKAPTTRSPRTTGCNRSPVPIAPRPVAKKIKPNQDSISQEDLQLPGPTNVSDGGAVYAAANGSNECGAVRDYVRLSVPNGSDLSQTLIDPSGYNTCWTFPTRWSQFAQFGSSSSSVAAIVTPEEGIVHGSSENPRGSIGETQQSKSTAATYDPYCQMELKVEDERVRHIGTVLKPAADVSWHHHQPPNLLQHFLYMMLMACGRVTGLDRGSLAGEAAAAAVDSYLYGLKLNDGNTLLIDRDFGLVLKENRSEV